MRFALLWFMAWNLPIAAHPDLWEVEQIAREFYDD